MATLIASHSQGRYFSRYHSQRCDVMTSFHPGFRVEQMFGAISDLIPAFDIVVLHIGANNLGCEDAGTVFSRFQTLFSDIRMAKPGYVLSYTLSRFKLLLVVHFLQSWRKTFKEGYLSMNFIFNLSYTFF